MAKVVPAVSHTMGKRKGKKMLFKKNALKKSEEMFFLFLVKRISLTRTYLFVFSALFNLDLLNKTQTVIEWSSWKNVNSKYNYVLSCPSNGLLFSSWLASQ